MKTLLYSVIALITYALPCKTAAVYDETGKYVGKTTWKEC